MFKPDWLSAASFVAPNDIVASAWHEHAAFAFWLVEKLQPRTIVELGVHHGFSYLTFCQAVRAFDIDATCFAIDTWKGDEHAGFCDDRVYQSLADRNQQYSAFSQLMRMTFEEGLACVADGSIDLLHIDGSHFHDDVKAAFEKWRPKLSPQSIMLFHGTQMRERNFGVRTFFDELSETHPSFLFTHGHGLGVVAPAGVPARVASLFSLDDAEAEQLRRCYARLGSADHFRWQALAAQETAEKRLAELRASEAASREALANAHERVLGVALAAEQALRRELHAERDHVAQLERNLAAAKAAEDALSRELVAVTQKPVRQELPATGAKAAEPRPKPQPSRIKQEMPVTNAKPAEPTQKAASSARQASVAEIALARRADYDGALPAELRGLRQFFIKNGRQLARDYRIIAGSPLFDAQYYLAKYRDVAESGIDPAYHYLRYGGIEARQPSDKFDAKRYLAANTDVSISKVNPLLHYLTLGCKEGRKLAPSHGPLAAPSADRPKPAAGKKSHRLNRILDEENPVG